jgi:uncharacterized membrane protein YqjE
LAWASAFWSGSSSAGAEAAPPFAARCLIHGNVLWRRTVCRPARLLGNEIEVQKRRALRELLLAQALLFCLMLGVLLGVALLTALFWEQRLLVLGALTVLFLGLAAGLFARLQRMKVEAEPVFAGSLAELQEDLRQLRAASQATAAPGAAGHAQKPD